MYMYFIYVYVYVRAGVSVCVRIAHTFRALAEGDAFNDSFCTLHDSFPTPIAAPAVRERRVFDLFS